MRYVAREENGELYITEVPEGASVAVGVGATLYETWEALLAVYPNAEKPL